MPLFVSERDRKVFSKINTELINNILETQIIYYQLSDIENGTNVYGENTNKIFSNSYTLYCLIERNNQEYVNDEGKLDYNITTIFYFLKDYLMDENVKLEIGNYMKYDNEFYQIDTIIENKYIGNKNPETSLVGDKFGWNVTIQCNCHVIDRSTLNIEDIRFG